LPNENLLIASYDKFLLVNIKGNFEFDTITLEKDVCELDDLSLISNNHIACTGVIGGRNTSLYLIMILIVLKNLNQRSSQHLSIMQI
jgi:hypothetical protein